MVLEEPAGAVMGGVREFFIRGQRQDDVTLGRRALGPQADEGGDEDRGHGLVVDGAARAEKAIGLLQGEGVKGPVFAPGLHHIHMGHEQHGPFGARTSQSRHQIALARARREHLHIGCRKACIKQALAHGLGGDQRIARGLRRVDFDELSVDRPKQRFVRMGGRLRAGGQGQRAGDGCGEEEAGKAHGMTLPLGKLTAE